MKPSLLSAGRLVRAELEDSICRKRLEMAPAASIRVMCLGSESKTAAHHVRIWPTCFWSRRTKEDGVKDAMP